MTRERTIGEQMATAFYGGRYPESHRQQIERDIMNIANTIQSDIRGAVSIPKQIGAEVARNILESAVLEVFRFMHQVRAITPDDYSRNKTVGVPAFQHGVAKARELLKAERLEEEKQARATDKAERAPVFRFLKSLFEEYHQASAEAGHSEPKVAAWEFLIDKHIEVLDQTPYAFYLLNWYFPVQYGIFDNPRVIEVCCKHPRLMDRRASFSGRFGRDAAFKPNAKRTFLG